MKALLFSVFLALSFCQHLTTAPPSIQPPAISSWAKQNVLDADARGVLVTMEWVRVYDALLKAYQDKLAVADRPGSSSDGIVSEGSNFRVSYVVQHRFAALKAIDRGRP